MRLLTVLFVIVSLFVPNSLSYADRSTSTPEYYIGQSVRLLQEGEFDRALGELRRGSFENPKSADIYSSIGNLQFSRGLFKEASQAFEKAVVLYQEPGEYPPTKEPFTRLDDAKHNLALTYTSLGRYKDAIKLHQAVRNPPFDNYGPDKGLAMAYLLNGNIDKSRQHLAFLLGHIQKTNPNLAAELKRLTDRVASGKLSGDALLGYLKASDASYDNAKSRDYLKSALDEDPEEPLFKNLLHKINNSERGYAIKYEERKRQITNIRALVYGDKNDKAIKAAKKFLKKRPHDPAGYLWLGVAHFQKGEAKQCIEAYLEGLRVAPMSDTLHYNLANTYLIISNDKKLENNAMEAAEHYALKTIEINSMYPDVHDLLAQIRAKQKQYQNAIDLYHKEAQITPKNPKSFSRIAEIYFQHLKNYPKAIEYYDKYLTLRPNDLTVIKWKSDAYYQMGDYANARLMMLKVKELAQNDATFRGAIPQLEEMIKRIEKKQADKGI